MGIFKKYWVEILFCSLFIVFAVKLNLQFVEGSNINTIISGHDEYLTVKEVNAILHPISGKHLLLSLISGDVFFYGRVMFYTDAAVAFIPDKIWGINGMVLAIRMFHALLLILSVSLLSMTFLKEKLSKILFFMAALTVAHSSYFTMLPKPEPFQLIFIAIFLYYFKKRNWEFGKHFIWLGLAFGTKFNLLVVLPLLFVVPFIWKARIEIKPNFKKGIWALVYFFVGFFAAVPSLLVSPFKPIYLEAYINANLKNTSKSYDDPNLSVVDWLGTGLGDTYFGWKVAGFIFIGVILAAAFYLVVKYKREKNTESLLLILIGIILMIVIAIKVKRLWPHYLWTGYLFASLGLIHFIFSQKTTKAKYILVALCTPFVLAATIKFVGTNYFKYSNADQQADVIKNKEDGLMVINYVKKNYPPGTNVATDGTLYYPFSEFIIANPYHPFSSKLTNNKVTKIQWYLFNQEQIWNDQNAVVVFYNRQPIINEKEARIAFADKFDLIKKTFIEATNSKFALDTIIGRAYIYKRNTLTK